MSNGKVLVVMGSDSDFPVMEKCFKMLSKFDVAYDAAVASAHRTPERAAKLASEAESEGYDVIIAAAGLAAHLAGVLAAHTTLPVIGVPCKGGALNGVLSTCTDWLNDGIAWLARLPFKPFVS